MGTRARIAVKHPQTGTFASIYTHWDGYPEHHGPILLEAYDTYEKVCALMALGDLSSLGRDIGVKRPFDNPHRFGSPQYAAWREQYDNMCLAYGRDRGEIGVEARTCATEQELRKMTEDCGGEWLYIFDAGAWYVAEGGFGAFGCAPPVKGALRRLDEVMAERAKQEA